MPVADTRSCLHINGGRTPLVSRPRRRPNGLRPMMLTSDIALKADPTHRPIAKHFDENPDELADAFARDWFTLTHSDMGPLRAI